MTQVVPDEAVHELIAVPPVDALWAVAVYESATVTADHDAVNVVAVAPNTGSTVGGEGTVEAAILVELVLESETPIQ